MKLMAGSYGTLSLLTEVTLKVLPRPETERTILMHGLSDELAIAAMAKALNTPFEVSGVAHLPPPAARRSSIPGGVASRLGAVTAIRLEGPIAVGCLSRGGDRRRLSVAGPASTQPPPRVSGRRSAKSHRLLPEGARVVWRICPVPSEAARVVDGVRARFASAERLLRLGRRPDLAQPRRRGGRRRRRRRGRARKPRGRRRPCDADCRGARDARAGARVRAGGRPARRADAPHQERVRSVRGAQSRPDAGGLLGPMQTNFSAAQLADPDTSAFPRKSCAPACTAGFAPRPARPTFCSATSSTARAGASTSSRTCWRTTGRRPQEVVKHVDRCLSCLSCMTTCPSGVNYMHLVDHARHHIEKTYRRPWFDRLLRSALGFVLPRPRLFRLAMTAGRLAKPFAGLLPRGLAAPLDLVPAHLPAASGHRPAADRPRGGPTRSAASLC